jgi:hypothetical protein
MGDVRYNTHPKIMYDLNFFQVPLFVSDEGFVYQLQRVQFCDLKEKDDLKTVIKVQMKQTLHMLAKETAGTNISKEKTQESDCINSIAAIV